MGALATADWILMGLIVMGGVAGFVRGLTREISRLICYLLSATAAWLTCVPVGQLLEDTLHVLPHNKILLAFILVFGGSWIFLWVLRLVASSLAEFHFKPALERIGGIVLGLSKNAAFLSLILLYMAVARPDSTYSGFLNHSLTGTWVQENMVPLYTEFAEARPDWYHPPDWSDGTAPWEPLQNAEQGNDRGDTQPE